MRAGKCTGCGEKDIRILQVHHLKPFAKGGSNNLTNLSVLCPNCHQKVQRGLMKPTSVAEMPTNDNLQGETPLEVIMKNMTQSMKGFPVNRDESKVEQHHISGPNVGFHTARDVTIYQSPQSISPQSAEHRKATDEYEIDEEFSLEPDGWRYFELELSVGAKLSGVVESDEDVSCWVLGPNSLQSFEDGDDFNPYWETEDVTKTKVAFKPKSGHKFFFVVYRDADADENASVSVKLRTEK
jgi:hypothetical protein